MKRTDVRLLTPEGELGTDGVPSSGPSSLPSLVEVVVSPTSLSTVTFFDTEITDCSVEMQRRFGGLPLPRFLGVS